MEMKFNEINEKLSEITETIQKYLEELCVNIPNRHVGSLGNREATDFFADTIKSFGFQTEQSEFDCMDWEYGEVKLLACDEKFHSLVGPYSPEFKGGLELVCVSNIKELEQADLTGKILMAHGDLASDS